MRSDFYVVSVPTVEGERFAILRPDHLPAGPLFWSSIEDWRQLFDQWVRATELLEEKGLRRRLADIGLPSGAVEDQIQRARNLQAFNAQTTGDRPTSVGYRNSQRQEVLRKTELRGNLPFQRVFVMRCEDCGREYGTNGCEIPSCRCPHCQNGPPGLRTSSVLG